MSEVLNFIISIVVTVLMGTFTTFLVILNAYKKEIWEEVERRYFNEQ